MYFSNYPFHMLLVFTSLVRTGQRKDLWPIYPGKEGAHRRRH
jgi:hypothetical protein